MGDSYDKVQERRILTDSKEKIEMITLSIATMNYLGRSSQEREGFLQFDEQLDEHDDDVDDEQTTIRAEWDGKINVLKKLIKQNEKNIPRSEKNIEKNSEKIENNIENTNEKRNQKNTQNNRELTKQIEALEAKMNTIVAKLDCLLENKKPSTYDSFRNETLCISNILSYCIVILK